MFRRPPPSLAMFLIKACLRQSSMCAIRVREPWIRHLGSSAGWSEPDRHHPAHRHHLQSCRWQSQSLPRGNGCTGQAFPQGSQGVRSPSEQEACRALVCWGPSGASGASTTRSLHTRSRAIKAHLPLDGSDAFEHACRIIAQSRRAFYIGITEDPVRRWMGCPDMRGHCWVFSKMVVVLEAPSSIETAALERRLISHFNPSADPLLSRIAATLRGGNVRCLNSGPGGERASSGSPHYCYVVFRADTLVRRH